MSNLISPAVSPKISIIGKNSELLALALKAAGVEHALVDLDDADLAIFIVSAADGIIRADQDLWTSAREQYIPSLIAISDLGLSDIDFEDMSAIAGKMLDPVVTPYLVLHSDEGAPVALIDLATQEIRDYSNGSLGLKISDPEHQELIAEFREEYLEQLEGAGEGAFSAGLLFPAIPWISKNGAGIAEVAKYLELIPTLG